MTATPPSPQASWRELVRRAPRHLAESARALTEGAGYLATAVHDDWAHREWHPRLYGSLVRHDLDRALDPWRWDACALLPRTAVYRVVLHAIARSLGNDDPSLIPAMEIVARWGSDRERAAAAQRRYRREDGVDTALHDDGSVTLAASDAAWLNVLLENARPIEESGPMAWGEKGRLHAQALLGYDEHGSILGPAHPRNRDEQEDAS